jgi:DNA-binding GntR family transcriptional regulator
MSQIDEERRAPVRAAAKLDIPAVERRAAPLRRDVVDALRKAIIETIPNKGPIVRQLTRGEAEDLYAIRSVLEGLAARMFVANASLDDIKALKNALDRTIDAYREGSPDIIMNVKNEFYEILFAGAGSETLSSMISMLHARIWRWRALGLGHPERSPRRSEQSIAEMRRLYDALKKRDADLAEEIARREVMNAAAEILQILARENADTL